MKADQARALSSGSALVSSPNEQKPLLNGNTQRPATYTAYSPPDATFARARVAPDGTRYPQTIAHRGNKAEWPENSLESLKSAIKVGADALETDVNLTKDGVVVLSHDPSLLRCFGKKAKIADLNWNEIKDLKSIKEPHLPLATFRELLEYLNQAELEHIWVLLDIKLNAGPEDMIYKLKEVFDSVPTSGKPWSERVVLGCWSDAYFPHVAHYLPDHPVGHIGFSSIYASRFLTPQHPSTVGFDFAHITLTHYFGRRFLRRAQRADRPVWAFTVNDDALTRWCASQQLDGVIADDPARCKRVIAEWADGSVTGPELEWGWKQAIKGLGWHALATVFVFVFTLLRQWRAPGVKFAKRVAGQQEE